MNPESRPPAAANQTVYWIIAILLAVIATALWMRGPDRLLPTALAQGQPLAGARGVFAFTGQLDHNRFGLFMLDVDSGTIWCYELASADGMRKLRLVAARTWIYDRYLQDFNCAPPDFRMVQQLVAEQRARSEEADESPPESIGEPAP
ncbi:MAG: hypothetical protein PVJ57_05725 [Phycisphaerae bacterium]|jgi:hypothetical protein